MKKLKDNKYVAAIHEAGKYFLDESKDKENGILLIAGNINDATTSYGGNVHAIGLGLMNAIKKSPNLCHAMTSAVVTWHILNDKTDVLKDVISLMEYAKKGKEDEDNA